MKTIDKLVQQFHPTSLKQMDDVKLLNRVDTKFICSLNSLPEILLELTELYKVLEINNKRVMMYRTKYYDTSDFRMYYEHQNGKLNRYKVRERRYEETNIEFLEIKFKSNKKRTLKSRITKSINDGIFSKKEIEFLNYKSPFSSEELQVKLLNTFNRITLCNDTERITVDFNLKFEGINGTKSRLNSLAIIEVKQSKYSINSNIVKILKKHQIRPCSFSKYCIGATMVYPNLKSNSLKSKFLLINKLSA